MARDFFITGGGNLGGGVAHQRDQHRFRVAFGQRVGDRNADIRAARDRDLMADAGFGDHLQHVGFGQQRRVDDQRAGNFDGIVHQQQDQVVRRGGVFGQAFGQGDTDRHFHVTGEALEDFAHQFAFAAVQP